MYKQLECDLNMRGDYSREGGTSQIGNFCGSSVVEDTQYLAWIRDDRVFSGLTIERWHRSAPNWRLRSELTAVCCVFTLIVAM